MHSFSLTNRRVWILLLIAVPSLFAAADTAPEENPLLTIEQLESEQVTLRFWVPETSVEDSYPEPLGPAISSRSHITRPAPSGMVDCLLIFRIGSYKYTVEGKEFTEKGILDGFLLLAAGAPPEMAPGGNGSTMFLVEYYCSSDKLADTLGGLGLPVKKISGKIDVRVRSDSSIMVEGNIDAEGYDGEWSFRTRTTDDMKFDTGDSVVLAYFSTDGELRALEIRESDDFFMKSVVEIEYRGAAPLNRWHGWQPAAEKAFYQYNKGNMHRILNVKKQTKNKN